MNEKEKDFMTVLRKIAVGAVISTIIASGLFLFKLNLAGSELLIYETIPFYSPSGDIARMFKIVPDKNASDKNSPDKTAPDIIAGGEPNNYIINDNEEENTVAQQNQSDVYTVYTDGLALNDGAAGMNSIVKIEDSDLLYDETDIIGTKNVIYQHEGASINVEGHFSTKTITVENINELKNIDNLKKQFYIVEKETGMSSDLFDIDKFMSANLKLDNTSTGPKVLIFHTHAREMFSDSNRDNPYDGVVGVGDNLAKVLKDKYGIESLHVTESFDTVNGKSMVTGAYERMEPVIEKVLAENPSIEFVIDIHRDGLNNPDIRLVTDINGKPTAKIMFVNGLARLFDDSGNLYDIPGLPNPYRDTNLALSFNMQLAANKLYPSFTRKIYLKGYRFSLNMCPKSVLVEIGAETNTKQEAFNTAEPLADIIASVVL